MKALKLMEFPLDAMALIEASAGTGKTYTLANLYLRYLLEKAYTPEQILVVTFTEAATQELRDRIRQSIHALLQAFADGHSEDATLQALLEGSEDHEADALRLRLAERQMDQAEIHTIHGFCQRLLVQHAVTLGTPIQQTLEQDLQPLVLEVVENYWREELAQLEESEQAFVLENWPSPEQLLQQMRALLVRSPQRVLPEGDWRERLQAQMQWHLELKQRTREAAARIREVIAASSLKSLNTKLKWLDAMIDWAHDESAQGLPLRSNKQTVFLDFTPSALEQHCKKGGTPPQDPFFDFLAVHLDALPAPVEPVFLANFYALLCERLQALKAQRSIMGFDDLIAQVDRALQVVPAQQKTLAHAVAGQYRVALIDEFQDTDQAQYRIFNTLFMSGAEPESPRNLVLIGDPKQAIYGFRGGDIATYLTARRDIAGHPNGALFTMDTNWRSSPQMVHAVNTLFLACDQPFQHADIPFFAVKAAKDASHNAPGAALQCAQLLAPDDCNKEGLLQALATLAVRQVERLMQSYQSSDIAILVRSGREGELIQAALAEVGVRASFEGQQNVFDTLEALSVYRLLLAVAEPDNDGYVRGCLSDPLLGIDDVSFIQLRANAHAYAEQVQRFVQWHAIWQQRGVLAMLRVALPESLHLEREGDAATQQAWERSVSNFNQLGELLQQQARREQGMQALVHYLYRQIHDSGQADDVKRLRLESDEALVKVITIHKSKGLEYPVVLLPFLFTGVPAKEAWFYDAQNRLSIDLAAESDNLALADAERLAEDMRLLYVALTRSRERCFIGTVAYKGSKNSTLPWWQTALGWLLCAGSGQSFDAAPDEHTLSEALQTLVDQSRGSIAAEQIALERVAQARLHQTFAASASSPAPSAVSPANLSDLQVRQLAQPWQDAWRVNSFTALARHHASQQQAADGASIYEVNKPVPGNPEGSWLSIHRFPRGAQAGTTLHLLFEAIELGSGELIDKWRFHYATLEEFIAEQLQRRRLVPEDRVTQWSRYLKGWMDEVRAAELWPGFSLNRLKPEDYIPELSFDFSVARWPVGEFNRLWHRYMDAKMIWQFEDFSGLMTGAIDLVCRHEGRYYLLDYKSNYLGEGADSYHAEALAEAMREHDYPLQYVIYTLALHRFLQHRLGARYDYDAHIGGAAYLFLRGMARDLPPGAGVYQARPPKAFIEQLDHLLRNEIPQTMGEGE